MRWCPWSSARPLQLHGKEVGWARRAASLQLAARRRANPKSLQPEAETRCVTAWCRCCMRARRSGPHPSVGSRTKVPAAAQQDQRDCRVVMRVEARRPVPYPSVCSTMTAPAAAPALVGGAAEGLSAARPHWWAGSSQRSLSMAHLTLRRGPLTASPPGRGDAHPRGEPRRAAGGERTSTCTWPGCASSRVRWADATSHPSWLAAIRDAPTT